MYSRLNNENVIKLLKENNVIEDLETLSKLNKNIDNAKQLYNKIISVGEYPIKNIINAI